MIVTLFPGFCIDLVELFNSLSVYLFKCMIYILLAFLLITMQFSLRKMINEIWLLFAKEIKPIIIFKTDNCISDYHLTSQASTQWKAVDWNNLCKTFFQPGLERGRQAPGLPDSLLDRRRRRSQILLSGKKWVFLIIHDQILAEKNGKHLIVIGYSIRPPIKWQLR